MKLSVTGKSKPRVFGSLALAVAFLAILAGAGQANAGARLNKPAPALTVTAVDGRVLDLEGMRGKVVLVTFWATWCGPCLAEMPEMSAFYRQHRAEGFEVIALSIDDPWDRKKVLRHLSKVPFPGAMASEASRNGFGVPEEVPAGYLIDAQGVVRETLPAMEKEILDETVLPLLKEGGVKPASLEIQR